MINFILTLPEIYLILLICILFFYNIIYASSKKYKFPLLNENTINLILLAFIYLICIAYNQPIFDAAILNSLFYKNTFSITLEYFLFIIGFIFFILTKKYTIEHFNSYEILLILVISFLGMVGMITSNHMFSMYLSLELQSICFYILVATRSKNLQAIEASLKYFILGSFSSAILLFGISYIYGYTGLVYFEDLAKFLMTYTHIEYISAFTLGLLLLFIGLLFKIYAAPFHFWISDIYQGASYNITMFFAIIPFISFFSVLVKLVYLVFYDYIFFIKDILLIVSIFSMLCGSIGALYQLQFKRLMAYSSIAHIGYFLTSLVTLDIQVLLYAVNYIFLYIITITIIFGIIINIESKKFNTYKYMNNLSDFYLFARYNKTLAFIFALSLFSLIGVPPLPGFLAKLFLLTALLNETAYILIFVVIVASLISAYYLLKIIKYMYFGIYNYNLYFFKFIQPIPYINVISIVYITMLTLLCILYPDFLIDIASLMTISLFI